MAEQRYCVEGPIVGSPHSCSSSEDPGGGASVRTVSAKGTGGREWWAVQGRNDETKQDETKQVTHHLKTHRKSEQRIDLLQQ
jgi:hypothetical protein